MKSKEMKTIICHSCGRSIQVLDEGMFSRSSCYECDFNARKEFFVDSVEEEKNIQKKE